MRITGRFHAMETVTQVAQLTERLEQIVVEGVHLHVGRRTTGAIYEQQKAALFGALALMTPQDRERLDGLLAAVEAQQSPHEVVSLPAGSVEDSVVEVATGNGPFALNGHHRGSLNGSQSHS